MDIDAEVIGQMPNIAFMTMKEAEKLRREVDEMHRLLSNEHKNRIEDLEKAKQYIDYLIDELKEEDDG